jgi:hypothetical protein
MVDSRSRNMGAACTTAAVNFGKSSPMSPSILDQVPTVRSEYYGKIEPRGTAAYSLSSALLSLPASIIFAVPS